MTTKKRFKETECTTQFSCHKCDTLVHVGDVCCWDQQYRTTANKSYRWCKPCADQEPQMFEPSENKQLAGHDFEWMRPLVERIVEALEDKKSDATTDDPQQAFDFAEAISHMRSEYAELRDQVETMQSTLTQCIEKIVALEEKKSIFNKGQS